MNSKRPHSGGWCSVLLGSDRSIYHPAIVEFFSKLAVLFCWHSVFLWTHCISPCCRLNLALFFLCFLSPALGLLFPDQINPYPFFFLIHNALDWAAQPQFAYRDPQGTAKPFTCTYLTNQQIACWQGGNAERGLQFSGGQFLSSAFAFSQASFSFQGHFCSINVWSGCK